MQQASTRNDASHKMSKRVSERLKNKAKKRAEGEMSTVCANGEQPGTSARSNSVIFREVTQEINSVSYMKKSNISSL